jgi:hypothetical protein
MPKDATKNVDRYKVRGGTLNEFEFAENQGEFSEQKSEGGTNLIPGTPPEKKAAGRKAWPKKISFTTRGATAKKLAAKKAAKKAATKKAAKKKAPTKKAAKKK